MKKMKHAITVSARLIYRSPRASASPRDACANPSRLAHKANYYIAYMFMAHGSSHAINAVIIYCNNLEFARSPPALTTRTLVNYCRRLIECPRRRMEVNTRCSPQESLCISKLGKPAKWHE